jgi:Tat protein secretion system quality control protein TatD with DNase activity
MCSEGIHPWFCHALSFEKEAPTKEDHYKALYEELPDGLLEKLPNPVLWSDFCSKLEGFLGRQPSAMIGEVGLDKSFRLPRWAALAAERWLNSSQKRWLDSSSLDT